jgi:thiamine pyrophosphate-dependent acetolactate synthase large subunit-like protein
MTVTAADRLIDVLMEWGVEVIFGLPGDGINGRVCLATSGPGGLHLLNELYNAKLDGQPVLAITGHPYHDLIGTHTQQDVELDKVFADVASYNVRVMGPRAGLGLELKRSEPARYAA